MNLEKEEALEEALEDIAEDFGRWTKEECAYTEPSPFVNKGMQCSNCYFYMEDHCQAVEGTVAAEGYCRFWVSNQVEKEEVEEVSEEEYSLTNEEEFQVAQELSRVLLSEQAPSFSPLDSMRGLAKKLYPKSELKDILLPIIKGQLLTPTQVEELSLVQHPVFQAFSSRVLSSLNKSKNMSAKQQKKKESQLSEASSSIEILSNGIARIPVGKLGEWKHDAYGTVKFTEKDFDDIVSNFNSRVLGFNPYATYGHLKDPEVETIDAELKKGEPIGFERDGDVLYALTQPKPDALELIEKGEYEYASGEFIRNYKDKESGEDKGTVLVRYALTNSPFLPFGDNKIELLSNGLESAQSPTTFVIKLTSSSGEISTTNTQKEETMQTETTSETKPEVTTPEAVEVVVATSQEQPTPETLKVKVENPGSVTSIPAAQVQAPAQTFDVNALVTQIKSVYEGQMDLFKQQAESTVAALKTELSELKTKLEQQTQVTQAFSNSLTAQQKQQRYSQIAAQGVPPVLIQKLSEIENALDNGSKVIKLSNTAGETIETGIADSIKDLLIDALNSEPVQLEQLGQTVSMASASGLNAELSRLIEQNKAAAKKSA